MQKVYDGVSFVANERVELSRMSSSYSEVKNSWEDENIGFITRIAIVANNIIFMFAKIVDVVSRFFSLTSRIFVAMRVVSGASDVINEYNRNGVGKNNFTIFLLRICDFTDSYFNGKSTFLVDLIRNYCVNRDVLEKLHDKIIPFTEEEQEELRALLSETDMTENADELFGVRNIPNFINQDAGPSTPLLNQNAGPSTPSPRSEKDQLLWQINLLERKLAEVNSWKIKGLKEIPKELHDLPKYSTQIKLCWITNRPIREIAFPKKGRIQDGELIHYEKAVLEEKISSGQIPNRWPISLLPPPLTDDHILKEDDKYSQYLLDEDLKNGIEELKEDIQRRINTKKNRLEQINGE